MTAWRCLVLHVSFAKCINSAIANGLHVMNNVWPGTQVLARHIIVAQNGSIVQVQVFGANIPGTKGRYMYGTGIISVIGTSFTFLNVTAASIGNMMVSRAHTPCHLRCCTAHAAISKHCCASLLLVAPAHSLQDVCLTPDASADSTRHFACTHTQNSGTATAYLGPLR